jgi:hypothetical protein
MPVVLTKMVCLEAGPSWAPAGPQTPAPRGAGDSRASRAVVLHKPLILRRSGPRGTPAEGKSMLSCQRPVLGRAWPHGIPRALINNYLDGAVTWQKLAQHSWGATPGNFYTKQYFVAAFYPM